MSSMRIVTALVALGLALVPPTARAQHLLVPMDDEQSNHLKAYGLTYNALHDGATRRVAAQLSRRIVPASPTRPSFAVARRSMASPSSRSMTATLAEIRVEMATSEHGLGAAREGAEDRGVHGALFAAVGRRGDAGAQVRGHSVHADLGRRGRARRPREVRLGAPLPRGLHGTTQQVLHCVPRCVVVRGAAANATWQRRRSSVSPTFPRSRRTSPRKSAST